MPDILRRDATTGFISFVKTLALTIGRKDDMYTGVCRSHREIEIEGTSRVPLRLEQSSAHPSGPISSDSPSVSARFSLIPNTVI